MRWLPFQLEEEDVSSRLMNKMIRPTTIPQSLEDLIVEHAVAREALRLGLEHHKTIATRLKGVQLRRTVSDILDQAIEETHVQMMNIDVIAGTGGLLSHAPRRIQSMIVLADAWLPEGITRMFQDSVFMMPHLGVLSTVHRDAAWSIFDKDCLVRLGTIIAATGTGELGEPVMNVTLEMPSGETIEEELLLGDIKRIDLPEREEAKAIISPHRGYDVGRGSGNRIESEIMGGVAGVLLDARGRPLLIPQDEDLRKEVLMKWYSSLGLYPEEKLKKIM
jgi:hypothetical protein